MDAFQTYNIIFQYLIMTKTFHLIVIFFVDSVCECDNSDHKKTENEPHPLPQKNNTLDKQLMSYIKFLQNIQWTLDAMKMKMKCFTHE